MVLSIAQTHSSRNTFLQFFSALRRSPGYNGAMENDLREMVQTLVDRCAGNQSEAARRIGVSPTWVNRMLTGKGASADPYTDTWQKLLRALDRDSKPWMTREARSAYTSDPRFQRLVDFMAALPPENRESFFTLARGLGFQED